MASAYKPTGYPKGRPRKGEIRPPTPGGLKQRRFRESQVKKLGREAFNKLRADYQRRWRDDHLERAWEISRSSYLRRRAWETVDVAATTLTDKSSRSVVITKNGTRYKS